VTDSLFVTRFGSRDKCQGTSSLVPSNPAKRFFPYAVGPRAAAPSMPGFGLLGRSAAERELYEINHSLLPSSFLLQTHTASCTTTKLSRARPRSCPFRSLPHRWIAVRRNFVSRLAFQPKRFGNQTQDFAGHIDHQQMFLAFDDLPVGSGRCRMGASMVLFRHVCVLHFFVCRKEIRNCRLDQPGRQGRQREN